MARVNLFLFICISVFSGCKQEIEFSEKQYSTENVIIVLIDGPRYSETWGDPAKSNIPRLHVEMAERGVLFTNFYNEGYTRTISGHAALLTGMYETLNNEGSELPSLPNLFQRYRKKFASDSMAAMLITSKDKLEILKNCRSTNWKNEYLPYANCGENGLGTGARKDIETLNIALELLKKHHPKLVLISFKEPDYSGHQNDWTNYLNGIKNSDEYAYKIWNYINSDTVYKDKTSFFIVNDHGRHLDEVEDGFKSHGDNCQGCKHILLYGFGPDFKENLLVTSNYDLVDLHETITDIFHLNSSNLKNNSLQEIFKTNDPLIKE